MMLHDKDPCDLCSVASKVEIVTFNTVKWLGTGLEWWRVEILQNFYFESCRKMPAFGKEMEDNIVVGYAG
jgi:hypothetical protein